jgi:hypothetical protein
MPNTHLLPFMYSVALLFRRWCDLGGKKKEKAANTYYRIVKKINFALQIYIKLIIIFDFEIFIWCHIAVSSRFNNKVNWVNINPHLFRLPYYPTVLWSRLGRIIWSLLYMHMLPLFFRRRTCTFSWPLNTAFDKACEILRHFCHNSTSKMFYI